MLWTVPVIAQWGNSGFSGVWGEGTSDGEWWRFNGDWYCPEEGGGGGVLYPNINPDPYCDPINDPRCAYKPMNAVQKNAAKYALEDWKLDTAQIANDTVQAICQELFVLAWNKVNEGLVKVTGNDSVPPDSVGHYAATDPDGTVHVEPWLLKDAILGDDKAQWELAASLMHEVVHSAYPPPAFVHGEPAFLYNSYYYRGRTTYYPSIVPFSYLDIPLPPSNPAYPTCMKSYP